MTFDLFNLYAKVVHRKLLMKELHELNDFCFDRGSHKHISVNRFGAKWVSKSNSYLYSLINVLFKKL